MRALLPFGSSGEAVQAGRSRRLDPVGDKDVRLALHLAVAIRGPDELFAVRRKHGEGVELGAGRDLLESRAVAVHEIQVEVPGTGILIVRSEDDTPAIGVEIRREAGAPEVRDLPLM